MTPEEKQAAMDKGKARAQQMMSRKAAFDQYVAAGAPAATPAGQQLQEQLKQKGAADAARRDALAKQDASEKALRTDLDQQRGMIGDVEAGRHMGMTMDEGTRDYVRSRGGDETLHNRYMYNQERGIADEAFRQDPDVKRLIRTGEPSDRDIAVFSDAAFLERQALADAGMDIDPNQQAPKYGFAMDPGDRAYSLDREGNVVRGRGRVERGDSHWSGSGQEKIADFQPDYIWADDVSGMADRDFPDLSPSRAEGTVMGTQTGGDLGREMGAAMAEQLYGQKRQGKGAAGAQGGEEPQARTERPAPKMSEADMLAQLGMTEPDETAEALQDNQFWANMMNFGKHAADFAGGAVQARNDAILGNPMVAGWSAAPYWISRAAGALGAKASTEWDKATWPVAKELAGRLAGAASNLPEYLAQTPPQQVDQDIADFVASLPGEYASALGKVFSNLAENNKPVALFALLNGNKELFNKVAEEAYQAAAAGSSGARTLTPREAEEAKPEAKEAKPEALLSREGETSTASAPGAEAPTPPSEDSSGPEAYVWADDAGPMTASDDSEAYVWADEPPLRSGWEQLYDKAADAAAFRTPPGFDPETGRIAEGGGNFPDVQPPRETERNTFVNPAKPPPATASLQRANPDSPAWDVESVTDQIADHYINNPSDTMTEDVFQWVVSKGGGPDLALRYVDQVNQKVRKARGAEIVAEPPPGPMSVQDPGEAGPRIDLPEPASPEQGAAEIMSPVQTPPALVAAGLGESDTTPQGMADATRRYIEAAPEDTGEAISNLLDGLTRIMGPEAASAFVFEEFGPRALNEAVYWRFTNATRPAAEEF
jgi:hypothetical protein